MLKIKGLSGWIVVVGLSIGGVAFAEAPRRAAVKAKAPSATEVLMTYQRVGRDIIQLQNLRGAECALELWKTFRAMKLDGMTASVQARVETAATLADLQQKIERRRGVVVHAECLNNPLAADCQATEN